MFVIDAVIDAGYCVVFAGAPGSSSFGGGGRTGSGGAGGAGSGLSCRRGGAYSVHRFVSFQQAVFFEVYNAQCKKIVLSYFFV